MGQTSVTTTAHMVSCSVDRILVHEILRNLVPGARVLDLGCKRGSFSRARYPYLSIFAIDIDFLPGEGQDYRVQADAAAMPFADSSFDAVIANHSLEHVASLPEVLSEIGRVTRPTGSLFVSVPDASTVSDILYRWVYHGGGHINPFYAQADLMESIASRTGLRPAGWRTLHTSFSFLAGHHFHPRPPRRMWLFANGNAQVIAAFGHLLRKIDRLFSTRLSVYGWALYFGTVPDQIDVRPSTNVCMCCGSGVPDEVLIEEGLVRGRLLLPDIYNCPSCGAENLFSRSK